MLAYPFTQIPARNRPVAPWITRSPEYEFEVQHAIREHPSLSFLDGIHDCDFVNHDFDADEGTDSNRVDSFKNLSALKDAIRKAAAQARNSSPGHADRQH